jgi:hypothetical protein
VTICTNFFKLPLTFLWKLRVQARTVLQGELLREGGSTRDDRRARNAMTALRTQDKGPAMFEDEEDFRQELQEVTPGNRESSIWVGSIYPYSQMVPPFSIYRQVYLDHVYIHNMPGIYIIVDLIYINYFSIFTTNIIKE